VKKLYYAMKFLFLVCRFWYRFWTGRPLNGERKTDSTFRRRGTFSLDPSKTALRWEMLAGWHRLLWRIAGLYLLFLLIGVLLLGASSLVVELPPYLRPSFILLAHVAVVCIAGASWLLRRHMVEHGYSRPILLRTEEEKLRLGWTPVEGRRMWLEEKVLPVSRAAALILTTSIPDREAAKWVTVPKNYREPGGSPVEIRLPSTFTGADEGVKKRLLSSVNHRLGMRGAGGVWQLEGSSPRVLISSPPEPPTMVTFADVERFLLQVEEYRPLLGVMGNSSMLHAEMVEDSPHVAVSGGPGSGKSTLMKLIITQVLRWGWGLVILDWKQTEAYHWAIGLQGVTYLTDIEAIHDMGERLHQEVDLRKSAGLEGRAKVMVVRDEWNATADLLQAYWTDYRAHLEPEERRTTPVKSPALRGYAVLDFAGREFGLHDLVAAQRFSARVFNGNADIRECFQIKALARYSDATRKMLCPDIKPFPKKSNTPGRWTIVAGEDVAVVQVPFITGDEARAFASGGVENPITPFSSSYNSSRTQHGDAYRTQEDPLRLDATPDLAASDVLEGEVLTQIDARKLSDMIDGLEPLGITHNILRNAARDDDKGDPSFPPAYGGSPNRGYTYDYSQVKEWARRRHASIESEKGAR
jgi:hypothetical protein